VIGFMIFWALNLWVVLRGAESIKWLETLSAPLLVLVGLGLLVWALPNVSMTELLAQPPKRPEGASVYGYFFAGLTAMVGFWATLSLNIPDFSRYAKSQKDQILGQIFWPAADHVPVCRPGCGDDRRVGKTGRRYRVRPGQPHRSYPEPGLGGTGDGIDHHCHAVDQHRGQYCIAHQ
jgi:Cytosine/uracil/thiamine/allantoin permeases